MNKILTFYSESHIQIFEEYFLPSYKKNLSDKFNLISEIIPQICKSGEFASDGFDLAMLKKIELIVDNIKIEEGGILIFSDCDVQFFGSIDINLQDYDILFQKDYFQESRCAGFFICKQNQKVLNFFNKIKQMLQENLNGKIDDQFIINKVIKERIVDIKHGYLPTDKFWTVGNYTNGKVWNGGDFQIPESIIVHHANFTIGIQNKINLLNLVKDKFKKKI